MPAYVMLTQVASDMLGSPRSLETAEHNVMAAIRADCPTVKWMQSYAVMGPYDYMDVFQAPDNDTATRVSMLVRTYGRGTSQVWPATEWNDFEKMIEAMPEHREPPMA